MKFTIRAAALKPFLSAIAPCLLALALSPVTSDAQGPLSTVPGGSTIAVSVQTAPGGPFTFQWRSTDGEVIQTNAASTFWTLPRGQGVHFLYVLISNAAGGYTERRIAIATLDPLGSVPAVVAGTPIPPTPNAPVTSTPKGIYRNWIEDYRPDVRVQLVNETNGALLGPVQTDLEGEYVFFDIPVGRYQTMISETAGGPFRFSQGLSSMVAYIETQTARSAYRSFAFQDPLDATDFAGNTVIAGQVRLTDQSLCGTRNPFFGNEVTATAELVDAANTLVRGPVRVNAFGNYQLDADVAAAGNYRLRVRCEQSAPLEKVISIAPTAGMVAVLKNNDFTIPASAPAVTGFTATFNGQPIQLDNSVPQAAPSDNVPAAAHFLTTKGIDSRIGACQYYRAIGAVQSCDASGKPSGGLTFDAWKLQSGLSPYNSTTEFQATYVNQVDLNLTRNHHGTKGANGVAMYVCNYLGPKSEGAADVDAAIDNALQNRNLVACVAMDYRSIPNANSGAPFTRFLAFGPSGDLLLSVNLDGRGEKFVPGTCVACHGGDYYAGRFPADGKGRPNIGAHFLPFDNANFAFSSKIGLRPLDQAAAIRSLNGLVMQTDPTQATQNVINAWYKNGTDVEDNSYLPDSYATDANPASVNMYNRVIKHSCRTCHVAFPDYDTDDVNEISYLRTRRVGRTFCGGTPYPTENHSMPNSKVTFDRMWRTQGSPDSTLDQIAAINAFYGFTAPNLCSVTTPDILDFPLVSSTTLPKPCRYTVTPAQPLFVSAQAQTVNITLTTSSPSCPWTAFTIWDLVALPGSGVGSGTVSISVPANLGPTVRNLSIAFAENGNSFSSKDVEVVQGVAPAATPAALRFVSISSCRLVDTRQPNGSLAGPSIPANGSRDFPFLASACGVPGAAKAYSLNVTAVPKGPLGYLTVWPTGQPKPVASTLNSLDARVKANAVIVPSGTGGAVSAFATNATDVVIDINGYFVLATDPTALAFYPLAPCRVADTRAANGAFGGPFLSGGQKRTFPILASSCNIPAAATAFSMNYTAVPRGPLGFLTTWPTGLSQPVASTLNAPTGAITANAAIVRKGTNGSIDVFVTNDTDLVLDINGYFAPAGAGGLSLYPVNPCRVTDTRQSPDMPELSVERPLGIVASSCGVPGSAQTFVLNATVVPETTLGYLTLWPGGTRPIASTLNALDGAITSNMAIVPALSGVIRAFAPNLTDLILDLSGYFAP